MNILIFGCGYVGLVTGVSLAKKGNNVTCIEPNDKIVKSINKGIPHIHEKDLEIALKDVIEKKLFKALGNVSEVNSKIDLIILAVGTPSLPDGAINLEYVKKATKEVGLFIKEIKNRIAVVVKSTVIPGTTDTLVKSEIEKYSGKSIPDFGLGMNPEFLREGSALSDFNNPDRIVIGHEDPLTRDILKELYSPWNIEKLFVTSRTAEMIKYANNSLLACQISIINELANLTSRIGRIDIMDVVKGISLDNRWNPILEKGKRLNPEILKYLIPGSGFGGSCFPKDIKAIVDLGKCKGYPMRILDAVININNEQPNEVIKIIKTKIKELVNVDILLLGIAFKEFSDDIRDSTSIKIIEQLLVNKANIFAHDPACIKNFRINMPYTYSKVTIVKNWKKYIKKSKIIIVATKWPEYLELKKENLEGKFFMDVRRMFEKKDLKNSSYMTIGFQER